MRPLEPPSVICDEARAWTQRMPTLWAPARESTLGPAETLAAVGVLALSAWLGDPCGWDGQALRGRADLLAALARARTTERLGVLVVWVGERRELLAHRASKLWVGQVTADLIWTRSQAHVAAWLAARNEARHNFPDADDPRLLPYVLPLDRVAEPLGGRDRGVISATGYDQAIIGDPAQLGFSPAKHNIEMTGGRPLIEMLGLIGAAKLESARRWRLRGQPRLPRLWGTPLRDVLDLDQMLLHDPRELRCEVARAGRRFYLHQP